jgi:preprotein translocase subunit SecD
MAAGIATVGAASPSTSASTLPASSAQHVLRFRQVVGETTPASSSNASSTSQSATGSETAASGAAGARCASINTTQNTSCATADVEKQISLLGRCSKASQGKVEAAGYDDPTKPIAACDRNSSQIYILAPAYMSGNEISKAQSLYDATQGYLVQLNFTGKGTTDFGKLTSAVNSLSSPLNQVAIVLDGVVESAPTIESAIVGGNAQITGGTGTPFTQADTDALAKTLNAASLR